MISSKNNPNPWADVNLNEADFKTDKGDISNYSFIEFNLNGNTLVISNLYYNTIYIETIEKIRKNNFTQQDFNRLILFFELFTNNLIFLFQKISPKLIDSNDKTFHKILKTIEISFSPLCLEFYFKGQYYFLCAETLYSIYLSLLRKIEEITKFRIHKGVPLHMLGLIYKQTDRIMRMFCQLGTTLYEDRKTGITGTPADALLEEIHKDEIQLFEESYNEVISDNRTNVFKMQKQTPILKDLFPEIRDKMAGFPDYALSYLTIKSQFMKKYLYEKLEYNDIFSSILRVELLIFFTAFIETLLKRVLQRPELLIHALLNEFNDKALDFNCKILGQARNWIPSYDTFLNNHNKEDPDFYQEFCKYILNITISEPTDINYFDITTQEKLKIFQSSMIVWQTRNRFHHELDILLNQTSLAKGIPSTVHYISDINEFNQILNLHMYYTSLILYFAYDKFTP